MDKPDIIWGERNKFSNLDRSQSKFAGGDAGRSGFSVELDGDFIKTISGDERVILKLESRDNTFHWGTDGNEWGDPMSIGFPASKIRQVMERLEEIEKEIEG